MIGAAIIRPSLKTSTVLHRSGDTQDIINAVRYADAKADGYVDARLAQSLVVSGDDYATLRNVWAYVRNNVTYRADTRGHEVVKSPGALFHQFGYGDCKSFSVAVAAILRTIGYDHVYYRFAGYKPDGDYTHMYVVVKFADATVAIDSTYGYFNSEVPPTIAKDYPATGGRKSGHVNRPMPQVQGQISNTINLLLIGVAVWVGYSLLK